MWFSGLTNRQMLKVMQEAERVYGKALKGLTRNEYNSLLAGIRDEMYPE